MESLYSNRKINTEISIFKNVYDVSNPHHKSVFYFLDRIKNGSLATPRILEYRTVLDDNIKKQLPACTFSGTFSHRSAKNLIKYSQFACLDFDKFKKIEEVEAFKAKICKDKHVFACFVSPSGLGLKAIFKTIDDFTKYDGLYRAICNKYNIANIDKKTKDISRLCYESYDPNIYINEDAQEWSLCEEEELNDIGYTSNNISVPLKSESRIIDILQKWFERKYSMVKGKRNENIYAFAIALNKFGINKMTASNFLCRYSQKDFTESEIKSTVASVYSKYGNEFGTRVFEDEETKREIRKDINNGKNVKDIKRRLEKENHPILNDNDVFEKIVENIKEEKDTSIFWNISDKGKISLVPHKYDSYLVSNNFLKFYPEINQDTFIFVQKDKNMIELTGKEKIKDFVLDDLRERKDIGFKPFDYMAQNVKFFSNDFLSMLRAVDIEIKRDTEHQCFLYYTNCVVEVGKDYTKKIDYIDIDKYVWKKSVIDREYVECDHHQSEFRSFIWFIAGQSQSSYNSFKSALGYLLHTYKTTADNKAVILNDEVISDTPNGRSGKGLFFTALKHLKKVDTIDGKDFSFDKNFKFQTVGTDCQILVFDDVKRNFEFEKLFSIITEGIEIEYKNQGTIKLPVEKSPKIVITTNYTIKGEGGSFDARKYELELSSYFNKDFTPIDHFGHRLFDNWDDSEWHRFDNFMIQCIQYYLKFGLQTQHHKNLELRKYMTETSNEFFEWANEDNLPLSTRLYNSETFNKFTDEYSDLKIIKARTFKDWVRKYCDLNDFVLSDDKFNNRRYFYITRKNEVLPTYEMQEEKEKEFPF